MKNIFLKAKENLNLTNGTIKERMLHRQEREKERSEEKKGERTMKNIFLKAKENLNLTNGTIKERMLHR